MLVTSHDWRHIQRLALHRFDSVHGKNLLITTIFIYNGEFPTRV
jgi:hypothetical protein